MIAIPGQKLNHQAVARYILPSPTIKPQAGVGGGIPTPKKLKDDSSKMTNAVWSVIRTRRLGTTLGKMCRMMIR